MKKKMLFIALTCGLALPASAGSLIMTSQDSYETTFEGDIYAVTYNKPTERKAERQIEILAKNKNKQMDRCLVSFQTLKVNNLSTASLMIILDKENSQINCYTKEDPVVATKIELSMNKPNN